MSKIRIAERPVDPVTLPDWYPREGDLIKQVIDDKKVNYIVGKGIITSEEVAEYRESKKEKHPKYVQPVKVKVVKRRKSKKEKIGRGKARSKPVIVKGTEYPSMADATRETGICHGTIRYRISKKRKGYSKL